jgi:5-hydroxyisourate hydrolase-like protein (transthyretin family)
VVHLTNCAPLPLHVSVKMDGYEAGETVFDHLQADDRVKLSTRRALPIAGKVRDAASGQPISGAGIYLIGTENAPGLGGNDPWRIPWDRGIKPMAVTDADGDFKIESLPQNGSYGLMAQVAGHASVMMEGARPGQTNLSAALGPEVVVRGRIEGDLRVLTNELNGRNQKRPHVLARYQSPSGRNNWGQSFPVRVEDGVGYFEFTNLTDGPLGINAGGTEFTKDRSSATNEWVIRLPESRPIKRREVAIRFVNPAKVAPKGTIALNLPGPYNSTGTEVELTNGEAHCEALIGSELTIGRGHMVGFWFNNRSVAIVDGNGPQVITIDTIPAGAIYAEAHNADGTLADDALFALRTVNRSPHEQGMDAPTFGGQSLMGNDRRRYAAGPLPLDGTYQVIAYRGNNFCASEAVTISAAEPDRKLTLLFGTGARLAAQVFGPSGLPASNASVEMNCSFTDYSIGLTTTHTDETGRFEYADCEPSSGKLVLTIRSPGMGSVIIEPDLKKMPLIVNLQAGLKVSGQVVDQKTGKPFPHAGVFASPSKEREIGRLPLEKTVADEQGRFVLDTLEKGDYYVQPNVQNGGYSTQLEEVQAGQAKPVVLKVTLNQSP